MNPFYMSLEFFAYILAELTVLFLGVSTLVGLAFEYLSDDTLRRWLSRKGWLGYFLGAALGAVTPFCSCSTIPMAVGLIGGATKLHPTARACLKILGVETADRLARIIAAVGLAQNFSALKALATTGIQKGHMSLHAQNIAMMAGATGGEIARVAEVLVRLGTVRVDVAEGELKKLRG